MRHLIDIYGLIFKCPLQLEDKKCPYWNIRQKEPYVRVQIVNEMTNDQSIKLYLTHKKCFETKRNGYKPETKGQ